jgi:hypothetical protein
MRRVASLLPALLLACGPDTQTELMGADTEDAPSTDSDGETDGDENLIQVVVADHQFECSETCSTWTMRNDLTLRLTSLVDSTVTVEWTRFELDGVVQASATNPIDLAVVELTADTETTVELSGRPQQCSPGISGQRTGRFFLTADGYTFEIVAPSTFISVPRPEGC